MKLKLTLFLLFAIAIFLIGCNNQTTTIPTTENITSTTDFLTTTINISTTTTTNITTTTTTSITTADVELLNIEIDESSLEEFYDVFDFDISEIFMYLNYSDSSQVRIPLNSEMLSTGDNDLLTQVGIHSITVSYENKSLELTLDLRDTRVFEVVFKDYNNYIIDIQYVLFGEGATAPTEPTREGYVFFNWDTDFSSVEENLVVHAMYQPLFYSVTFDSMGGSDCIPVNNVIYNTLIELPTTYKEGYIFLGWFLGSEPTDRRFYDDDLVTGDITLYAHWEEIIYEFTYLEDEYSIEITGLYHYTENLIIPTQIKGKPVVGIAEKAFINNSNLYNVVLPDTLEYIGDYAFYGNENLLNVSFGSGLLSIGNGAFYGCKRIETIILPEGLTYLGDSVFAECSNLIEISIPFTTTEIGGNLLVGCLRIETMTVPLKSESIHYDFSFIHYYFGAFTYENTEVIPDSLRTIIITEGVTHIPDYAFYYCDLVFDIIIPSTVTSIGNYSFMECVHVTNYILPEGLLSIGMAAFSNNDRLTSINLPNTLEEIGEQAFFDCGLLNNIIIPEGITTIEYLTFGHCSHLNNVTFPSTLLYIKNNAFYNGYKNANLTLPNGLLEIGNDAFNQNPNITTLVIPDSVYKIGSNAFLNSNWYNVLPTGLVYAGKVVLGYKGTMVTDQVITLDVGTKGIAANAFINNPYMAEIIMPDTVIYIGENAFRNNSNLSSVTMSENLIKIETYAFAHCTKLQSIYLTDSITYLGEAAFYNCDLLTVTIPDSLEEIGRSAFGSNDNLATVTFNTSLVTIGDYAFKDCISLTSISLPATTETVGIQAFANNTSLISIDLASVNSVLTSAFMNCTSLDTITFPSNLRQIGEAAFTTTKWYTDQPDGSLVYAGNVLL
ncbi:MAG: hypothetical protein CVV60_01025, partial [Tenericutes bacterium HGW-Tenericutes-5]